MPRLFSASKAAQSLVFESNGFRQLRHVKVGCLSSIAGLNATSSLDDLIYKEKCLWVPLRRFDNAVQSRRFRGFGNGGTVGDDLHNNFEERRVIGYVTFVPFCRYDEMISFLFWFPMWYLAPTALSNPTFGHCQTHILIFSIRRLEFETLLKGN
ncbi:hypothetical protein Scep_014397 [Stephania cephalantha]|uniref:Uncharacterized protein n=1 Tax=Stephania cephalantha TaxID=152367 RepID=A0AAP0J3R7_9MAGN